MSTVAQWRLRAEFARRLSAMYAREVPAYATLVEVSQQINAEELHRSGADAERLGSIDRVTEERHGAIRVGTPDELGQVARIFGALGMHPVGFYDLREAAGSPVPVISTGFRPIEPEELARNPFRVFTSMLTPDDPRFFDSELRSEIEGFLARRTLFPPELLALAGRAEREQELAEADARRFLDLAVASFELSQEPVDRAWYQKLGRVSSVAADIAGVRSTHLNHLTPRVLDIDALHERMTARGIAMIDAIQGPPRWEGPDVLLRQTSFRALAEPRRMRLENGSVIYGTLRVRFGEVEARGIALTPEGRARYDRSIIRIDEAARESATGDAADRAALAAEVWRTDFPATERGLLDAGLGYFTYRLCEDHRRGEAVPAGLGRLLDRGWLRAVPIVYEDFLPKSAAGIFRSNLAGDGVHDSSRHAAEYDRKWLAAAIGREIHDPFELYAQQQNRSIQAATAAIWHSRWPPH